MDTPLIRSIFEKHRGAQTFKILTNNEALGAWLRRLGACDSIARHFTACMPSEDAELPYGVFLSEAGLRQTHQEYPQVVDAGFVTIGFGDEGDFLVLDLQSGAMGFIAESEDAGADFDREEFNFLDDSLSAFMQGVEEGGLEAENDDRPARE